MKRSIYLETSIISYLAAWPSRDLVIAAHQGLTREWWQTQRTRFDLFISQVVVQEASAGDPDAAARRHQLMIDLPRASVTEEAIALAERIARDAALPPRANLDAMHVAVAATHGIGIILTWNCKHIASVTFRPRIESVCRSAGINPPVICTPLELMEL